MGECAIISKMSEPLIGPSEPLKIWTTEEAGTDAEPAVHPMSAAGDEGALRRVMVTLWVVCVVTVQVAGFVYPPASLPRDLNLFAFWLGTAWAGWAAAVWVSSRWSNRPLTRGLFLVAMFAWHGLGMSVVNDETAARYVVMLGSYGMLQAVVFHWLGIPRWQILRLPLHRPTSPFEPDSVLAGECQVESHDGLAERGVDQGGGRGAGQGDVTRQFGIGDLIAITTLVAILITAGKSYQTLLADSFWWGLIVGEAVLLAVAVLSVLSGLATRLVELLALLVLAVATGVGGSVLLDFIESLVSVKDPWSLWPVYTVLMTTFSILMVAFAALSMTPLRTPMEPLDPVAQKAVTEKAVTENDRGDQETGSQSPL